MRGSWFETEEVIWNEASLVWYGMDTLDSPGVGCMRATRNKPPIKSPVGRSTSTKPLALDS